MVNFPKLSNWHKVLRYIYNCIYLRTFHVINFEVSSEYSNYTLLRWGARGFINRCQHFRKPASVFKVEDSFFNPEHGGNNFLRNIGSVTTYSEDVSSSFLLHVHHNKFHNITFQKNKNVDYEGYYILGCDVMYSGTLSTFRRNLLPPSSGLKDKPAKPEVFSSVASLLLC
jgi:hypothetical protein